MSGIFIGDKHTEKDWGLIWVDLDIPAPEIKTYTFEVPGANGIIDVTEGMGGVKYRNRPLLFKFINKDMSMADWHTLISQMTNAYHGQVKEIMLDNDPDFFWKGRVAVNSTKEDQVHSAITIAVDAKPYKYDLLESTDDWLWGSFNFRTGIIRNYSNLVIDQATTLAILGTDKDVTPTIICSKAMTLVFEGQTYALRMGENRNYDIVLKSGVNQMNFTVSGSGTVSIRFRGVSL
jgi:hypothetical protein